MQKHKCLDCGREFDVPERYIERHGFDYPPYEEYLGCPYCGGAFDEIDEESEYDEE